MPYNASVSVQFEADSTDEIDTIVKGWNLADGTTVFVSVSETLASGIVDGGQIIPPDSVPTGAKTAAA
jgi:hypothetical protein